VVGRHQPGFTAVAGGDYRRHRVVGLAAPLSRRPLDAEGGRIHACPVSTDSAGVLAAVLMTFTEVFVRESLRGFGGITRVRSNGGNHELPSG
jgi:hypothetical protein